MRKRLAVLLGILALLLPLASRVAEAYPISPVPLWELVENAETIVLADVGASEQVERGPAVDSETGELNESYWDSDTYAKLVVREVWKGKAPDTISVGYSKGLICPAPPRYVEGEAVIAFLREGDDGYHTVGLSYGTIYASPEGVEAFRLRVKEAVQLQKAPEGTLDQRLSWLARTAAHSATRWHGLYELKSSSDRLHSFYDRKGRVDYSAQMSAAEILLIAKDFAANPSLDRTLPMALEMLADHPSEEVDNAAIAAVDTVISQENVPWWVLQAIRLLLERLNDPYLELRFDGLDVDFSEMSDEEIREFWHKAKEELGIPQVEPLEIQEEGVWGVGSNTPS